MSTRHSFLSTTGLIRSSSSASTASHAPSFTSSRPAHHSSSSPGKKGSLHRLHKLKSLTLSKKPEPATPEPDRPPLRGAGGVIPLGATFIVGIGIVISLFFIGALSFAFIGSEDEPVFQKRLDQLATTSPGLVLIADNVDIDIDEPAVTLRWSVLACGSNFTLPGSEGTHGSSSCGIPNMPLQIYVDNAEGPEFMYDPVQLPFTTNSGRRLGIQNIYQFDSDHVLDVHEARLYPFDTYRLTTTLRAVDPATNESIPINHLFTITDTSSFIVAPKDSASYVTPAASTEKLPSYDLELFIARPGEARFFALMLFGVNWMLSHATVCFVAIAWKSEGSVSVLTYLVLSLGIMLTIPGVRNAMPDAPGYDGVLIDQIGFFAQMLLSGISTIALLATLSVRELCRLEESKPPVEFVKERPAPISKSLHRLRGSTTSVDLRTLRRPFTTTVQPPTPIREEGGPFVDEDPFAGTPSRKPTGTSGWGALGQNAAVGASSTTNLLNTKTPFSEWV